MILNNSSLPVHLEVTAVFLGCTVSFCLAKKWNIYLGDLRNQQFQANQFEKNSGMLSSILSWQTVVLGLVPSLERTQNERFHFQTTTASALPELISPPPSPRTDLRGRPWWKRQALGSGQLLQRKVRSGLQKKKQTLGMKAFVVSC